MLPRPPAFTATPASPLPASVMVPDMVWVFRVPLKSWVAWLFNVPLAVLVAKVAPAWETVSVYAVPGVMPVKL